MDRRYQPVDPSIIGRAVDTSRNIAIPPKGPPVARDTPDPGVPAAFTIDPTSDKSAPYFDVMRLLAAAQTKKPSHARHLMHLFKGNLSLLDTCRTRKPASLCDHMDPAILLNSEGPD